MAVQTAFVSSTNDRQGKREEVFVATAFTAGTLNGSTEHIVNLPPSGKDAVTAGNGWRLKKVVLDVGVPGTHADASLTATVEKNTDGGTSALTTAPVIAAAAGTGARKTTNAAGTGITLAVIAAAEQDFADTDRAFVTITETGSAGTDPADVSVKLVFVRLQDWDQDFDENI